MANPVTQTQGSVYLQEAATLLQQIEEEITTLHQSFTVQKVHTLMRLAHTLKGAAATVGLDAVKITTQTLEYAFRALCTPEARLTATVEGLIFEAYDCLKLLLSAQLDNTTVDEFSTLDRIAVIGAKLQHNLGARYAQESQLPTAAQLGVDVTQSIFASGVSEYLDELSQALTVAEPDTLTDLLQVQADVFLGLAESLNLPGFGNIAQTTLAALQQHPDQVIQIAHLALEDYRAGQTRVLKGDRNQGGEPSPALTQLSKQGHPQRRHWLNNLWQWLKQPISLTHRQYPPQKPASTVIASHKKQSIQQLFQRCQTELEQLTQQHGKPVLVQLKTNNIIISQTLAQQLYIPLQQLVHNAFTHDIEMPDIRQQQGKSALGRIQLAAKHTEQHLIICVWDDGCGPNPAAIYQQVQPHIEHPLKGTLAATHHPGKGTCFTLKIPLNI
ncbi:chemotaxis protein histidine kinase-like protein [Leptolyngbya sp. Heron Island J]|uniref:Hpt domain-containing protein n=1 Tax=Leptolyngbya sp. Heron Island J TaxID=1385935 RepID=UPI0003B97849|nr:Hpt domain-containing protein [Leptolyngbya sp. Heron Island J]ESA38566.1 chemotaxis protein histidine kinase-like protein [Leptolyngbya sp. Heron Island J]